MAPHILGAKKEPKDRVAVSLWSRIDTKFKDGKVSHTFTVEDTTLEELEEFIKKAIQNWDEVNKVIQ